MKMMKRTVRTLPRFLLFAGLLTLALFLTGNAASSASPDFSLSASPHSKNALPGQIVTYTVTVTALNGFNGTVSLSIGSATSPGCGGVFNPSTVTGSGSSQFQAECMSQGQNIISIVGTSGTLMHGTAVSLNVS